MDVQLIGSYSLEAPLGRGGMGLVYRARHLALDKEVAIKFMAPAISDDPVFSSRFLQEAKIMARIDHPNIVRVLDFGEHEQKSYLVMELLRGETLAERLKRQPPLGPQEAIRITSSTLGALEEIHQQNVVHRDIKPANIFLCASGAVKVMDFGIALTTSEPRMTETGKIIGTPEYMSPEQADGRPVTARSDLYSVGVVLYEMLAGKPPFTADSPLVVLNLHANRPLPPLPASVPTRLRQVVNRALAKQPASRFASASEMLEALKPETGPAREHWLLRLVKRFYGSENGKAPLPARGVRIFATAVGLVGLVWFGGVKLRGALVRWDAEKTAREAFMNMTRAHDISSIKLARAALALDPENSDARAALGATYLQLYNASSDAKNLAEAKTVLLPLRSHATDSAYTEAAIGALDYVAAPAGSKPADLEPARGHLEAAVKRDPQLAYGFYQLGVLEDFERRTAVPPATAESHAKAEEEDLLRAVGIDSHTAWANTSLAGLYIDEKRFAEAEKAANSEISNGSPTATTYNDLGVAQAGQDRHKEAEASFRKAIAKDSSRAIYHCNLAGQIWNQSQTSLIKDFYLAEAQKEMQKARDMGFDIQSSWVTRNLQADGYNLLTPFSPLSGSFKVWMPGIAQPLNVTGQAHQWGTNSGASNYYVYYIDIPVGEGTADQYMKTIGRWPGYVFTSSSPTVANTGVAGVAVRYSHGDRKTYLRSFAVGQRIYIVGVCAFSNQPLPKDADEYLNSFRLAASDGSFPDQQSGALDLSQFRGGFYALPRSGDKDSNGRIIDEVLRGWPKR